MGAGKTNEPHSCTAEDGEWTSLDILDVLRTKGIHVYSITIKEAAYVFEISKEKLPALPGHTILWR